MERVDAARQRSAPPYIETPAGLQEMAARARRLAHDRLDEQTIAKLTEFAEDWRPEPPALGDRAQAFSHEEAAAVQKAEQVSGDSCCGDRLPVMHQLL
jgi:hypothetical protein